VQLLLHGIVWFSLYVLFTLLPAGVALAMDPYAVARPTLVEFSVGLAFVAFPLLLAQFALVSRLRAASAPFGSDALMQFHRQIAIAALAFVVLHVILLAAHGLSWQTLSPFGGTTATAWGAASFWCLVVIVVSSIVRRRLRLRYEAWQLIHLVAAIVIVAASALHILSVAGYARAAPVRNVVIAYTAVFLGVAAWYRLLRPLLLSRRRWEVIANRDEGGSTRTIAIRPLGHRGLTFEPGQFAWLVTGRMSIFAQQHPLSISSSAEQDDERTIEFTIKALGDWSGTTVPALRPGDHVWVDGPFGAFTLDRHPAQGFVLIAGGIGISPMRSMLLTMRDREDRRHVVLLYAANDASRVVFGDELDTLRRSINLDVIYVFEHPGADWPGERGRVTADVVRRHLPPQFTRYQYYVCGPPRMMDALEDTLTAIGVPASHINTERFDMV
jgi:predicted ferric reductase